MGTIYDKLDTLNVLYNDVTLLNDYTAIAGDCSPFATQAIGKTHYLVSSTTEDLIELHGLVTFKRIAGFNKYRSNLFIYDRDGTIVIDELTGDIRARTNSILRNIRTLQNYTVYSGTREDSRHFDILIQVKFTGEIPEIIEATGYGFQVMSDHSMLWIDEINPCKDYGVPVLRSIIADDGRKMSYPDFYMNEVYKSNKSNEDKHKGIIKRAIDLIHRG